jgi:hypothetical protein
MEGKNVDAVQRNLLAGGEGSGVAQGRDGGFAEVRGEEDGAGVDGRNRGAHERTDGEHGTGSFAEDGFSGGAEDEALDAFVGAGAEDGEVDAAALDFAEDDARSAAIEEDGLSFNAEGAELEDDGGEVGVLLAHELGDLLDAFVGGDGDGAELADVEDGEAGEAGFAEGGGGAEGSA